MPSGSIEIENEKKEIKFKGYVTHPQVEFIQEYFCYTKIMVWMLI